MEFKDAEQSVLGAIFLDNAALNKINLTPADFYAKDNQVVFSVMLKLAEEDKAVDFTTLIESLKNKGQCSTTGSWLAYIGMLANDTPSAANVVTYAKQVKDASILRQLMQIGSDLYFESISSGLNVSELVGRFSSRILQAEGNAAREDYSCTIKEALAEAVDNLAVRYERYQDGKGIMGNSTGLMDLDEVTGGFQAPDFWVILAQSRMGKTALLLNFAVSANCPAGIISSEQGSEQLGTRFISAVGSIDNNELRTGNVQESSWARLTAATGNLSGRPIFINDEPLISIQSLIVQARKWKAEHNIQVLFVDYLQNITDTESKTTIDRVSNISRRLRALGKELGICIVALSQVKRDIDTRANKRPRITDASDASQIEKDGDVIIGIYREEVYNDETTEPGVAEIELLKNKHGEANRVINDMEHRNYDYS
jgi:replicative DNA helicase